MLPVLLYSYMATSVHLLFHTICKSNLLSFPLLSIKTITALIKDNINIAAAMFCLSLRNANATKVAIKRKTQLNSTSNPQNHTLCYKSLYLHACTAYLFAINFKLLTMGSVTNPLLSFTRRVLSSPQYRSMKCILRFKGA